MLPYDRYPTIYPGQGSSQVPRGMIPGAYPYQPGVFPAYPERDNGLMPGTEFGFVDPPPILSNNPVSTNITLFKELSGFPNYGNPSGNADILYTGNRGVWTFDVPALLAAGGLFTAQLVISAVLDDHYDVPVRLYSARILFNGSSIFSGQLNLAHGRPAGALFNNWRQLTFNIQNLRRNNRIEIVNTSNTGPNDWIALDWMEIRVVTRR